MHEPQRGRPCRVLASPAFENRGTNPYNASLYEAVQAAGAEVRDFTTRDLLRGWADVWHLHWPDHALHQPTLALATLAWVKLALKFVIAQLRRTRVVWTVHNATPHEVEYPRLHRSLQWLLLRNLDAWIALSDASREAAQAALPPLRSIPSWVVPHGHYRDSYPPPPSRDAARAALGIEPAARVLLFFGLIREYKNVPGLLDAFRELAGDDLRLVVAGKVEDPDLEARLRQRAAGDERVHLDTTFVPDELVPRYFAAADLTVIPFTRILNSGSAILSLSLDTPVLVPSLGSMLDLHATIGAPWVSLFDDTLTSDDLAEALSRTSATHGTAPLDDLAWPLLGERTLAVYDAVTHAPPGGGSHRSSTP